MQNILLGSEYRAAESGDDVLASVLARHPRWGIYRDRLRLLFVLGRPDARGANEQPWPPKASAWYLAFTLR